MSNIVTPNVFAPSTLAKSSEVNANFNEVQTKYNTYAVQTDVAKTITANHTFSGQQTFTANVVTNLLIGGTDTGLASLLRLGSTADGLVGLIRRLSGTNNPGMWVELNEAGSYVSLYGNGSAGALELWLGGGSTPGIVKVGGGSITFAKLLQFSQSAAQIVGGSTSFAIRNAANNADNVLVSDAGAVTTRQALTVAAGGAAITGNSTVTGNLNVTGTLSGGSGLNNFVRRTTDLTGITSLTDLTLSFAIGATEEWEAEWVLFHTNGSAATLTVKPVGPASFSYAAQGVGSVQGITGTTVSTAANVVGNTLGNFTMDATFAATTIRAYVKGGGTGGTVSLQATVSAGTGTLKSGSFVKYARIA